MAEVHKYDPGPAWAGYYNGTPVTDSNPEPLGFAILSIRTLASEGMPVIITCPQVDQCVREPRIPASTPI